MQSGHLTAVSSRPTDRTGPVLTRHDMKEIDMSAALELVMNARWKMARAVYTALNDGASARDIAEAADLTVDQILGLADAYANG